MKAFLILPLFVILLLIPSFGPSYGGVVPATTIWVVTGDGQSWSDPNNWDRQMRPSPATVSFNHALPEFCDLIIIDDGSNAVTVHFDLLSFQLGIEMEIGSDDTVIIDSASTLDHTPDPICQPLNVFVETIVNNGNLNVFGTLINNGAFINNAGGLNCGTISGTNLPILGIVNHCTVGGNMVLVETTSLLLVDAQANATWLIPVIATGIGFAVVIARRL